MKEKKVGWAGVNDRAADLDFRLKINQHDTFSVIEVVICESRLRSASELSVSGRSKKDSTEKIAAPNCTYADG